MLNSEITDLLLTTQLSQFIDKVELDRLIKHGKIVQYEPGALILKQGSQCEGLYIILEGEVLVTAKILGQGVTHIAKLGHGNFIGEISLIERAPCSTSALTTTETKCFYVDIKYFDMLALLFPATQYQLTCAILNEVSDRIRTIYQKIIDVMSHSEMVSRSLFGEVIQSFNKYSEADLTEIEDEIKYFQSSMLFEKFSQEEYVDLLQYVHLIRAGKNCVLVEEEEKNSVCYILLRGAVQSSIIKNNKIAKLAVLGPVHLFCNLSTIDNSMPNVINYTTCERAVLLKITAQDMQKLQQNNIHLWYKFFILIAQSLVSLERDADKLFIRLHSELYNYV